MQSNATTHRQWTTFTLLGLGLGAGLAAAVNWLGLAALRAGSWQTLALVSAAALAAALVTAIRHHQSMKAEARLQEVFDELAEREIARQERKRMEWWARNLSPAVALARMEQHRSYRFVAR